MDQLPRLRRLEGVKWRKHGPDVLACWVADMDLGIAPAIKDELARAVDDMDVGYHSSVYNELRTAFVERQQAKFGWAVEFDRTELFDDVLQAIEASLWWGTEPGDGVIIHSPVYPPFWAAIRSTGRLVVEQPLRFDGQRWVFDDDALEQVRAARPTAMILCNPHNPTGRSFGRAELEDLAALAAELDLLVISDEIHAELLHPGAVHVPFASVNADAAARTVTVTSASKAFNLAGLKCATAVMGHDRLRDRLAELPPHLLANVNALGARASLAAYRTGDAWLAETVALLTRNRDHVVERLDAELPGVLAGVPEATYLAWLDVRRFGLGETPAATLIERAGIAFTDGLDFGDAGAGFIRLNFATTPELLDEILDRLVGELGR
ncbi:MAG: aminotransferase class I/II-fold pyridoxal phosphate-dependent enzyme [Actinomycetota bacterium]